MSASAASVNVGFAVPPVGKNAATDEIEVRVVVSAPVGVDHGGAGIRAHAVSAHDMPSAEVSVDVRTLRGTEPIEDAIGEFPRFVAPFVDASPYA